MTFIWDTDIYEASRAGEVEIREVRLHLGSHEEKEFIQFSVSSWTGIYQQAIAVSRPKWSASHSIAEALGLLNVPNSAPWSQVKTGIK